MSAFHRDEERAWAERLSKLDPNTQRVPRQRRVVPNRRKRCQQYRLWYCNLPTVGLRPRHTYVTVALNEKPIGTWELSHCTKCGILVYEDMPF